MIAAVGGVGDLPLLPGKGIRHYFGAVWMSENGVDWNLVGVFDDPEYDTFAGAAVWEDDTLIVVGTVKEVPSPEKPGDDKAAIVWATPDLGETWYQIARNPYDPPPGPGNSVMWGPGFDLGYYSDAMSDVTTFDSQMVAVGGGIVWLGQWPTR